MNTQLNYIAHGLSEEAIAKSHNLFYRHVQAIMRFKHPGFDGKKENLTYDEAAAIVIMRYEKLVRVLSMKDKLINLDILEATATILRRALIKVRSSSK